MDAGKASGVKRTQDRGRVMDAINKRIETSNRDAVNQERAALCDILKIELHCSQQGQLILEHHRP